MSFSFFGSQKDNKDMAQAMEIKQMTTIDKNDQMLSSKIEEYDPKKNSQNPNIQPNSTFINPFSQPSQNNKDKPASPFAQPIQPTSQTVSSQIKPSVFEMSQTKPQEQPEFNSTNTPNISNGQNFNIQTKPADNNVNLSSNQPSFLPQEQNQIFQTTPIVQDPIAALNNEIDKKEIDEERIQEMIDETVEKIIEERWKKLVDSVEKVAKWKEKQEQQMNLVKEDIVHIKEAIELLEKKILTKINSYDTNIMDVNSEIKALEKVFQKITPTLINNVNELSRIADDLKGDKKENTIPLQNQKNNYLSE